MPDNISLETKIEKLQGELTMKLLKEISSHLSGRTDCALVQYKVGIKAGQDFDTIIMLPNIEVFPNQRTRTKDSKRSILEHVLTQHFHPTIFQTRTDPGILKVRKNVFCPGVYGYCFSVNSKYRRWKRLDQESEQNENAESL